MITESYFLIILSFSNVQPLVIDFFPDMKSCQNAIQEISSIKTNPSFGKPVPFLEPARMKCIPKQVD